MAGKKKKDLSFGSYLPPLRSSSMSLDSLEIVFGIFMNVQWITIYISAVVTEKH